MTTSEQNLEQVYTKSFQSLLKKFSKWCLKNNIKVQSKSKKEYSFEKLVASVKRFEEPKKDKLKKFLEYVYNSLEYSLVQNDFLVQDYNELVELFVNPEKYNSVVTEGTVPKVTKLSTEDIDFEEFETLPYYTETLIEALGKPRITGGKDCEHTYEWVIKINPDNSVLSIFDWNLDNTPDLDNPDKTWYIGYNKESSEDLKSLYTFLDTFCDLNEVEVDSVEIDSVDKELNTLDSKIKSLFVSEPSEQKELSASTISDSDVESDNE